MIEIPRTRIEGPLLRALVKALGTAAGRMAAARVFRMQLGIDRARGVDPALRTSLPHGHTPLSARRDHRRPSLGLGLPRPPEWPPSARALTDAYARGELRPTEAVERALVTARELGARSPSVGPLLGVDEAGARQAAADSERRRANGSTLGPLDGVLLAVKEEIDVRGLPTRFGTRWMPETPAERDAVVVDRLRRGGAIIVGQTPMTEYGLSPIGANAHRIMPRNPHNPLRYAGGSSTGSAVAVATGVVPAALGVDGGGSIRIPAAVCGVFGLKPTYGRLPRKDLGFGGTSVTHIGPIASSTWDLAAIVEASAGSDAQDAASEAAPPLVRGELDDALGRGVKGLVIGVDESSWEGVADDVQGPAREALDALVAEGAAVVPISLPLGPHAAAIGYVTIGLEIASSLAPLRERHWDELGYDVRMIAATLDAFRADDYVDALRLRHGLRTEYRDALAKVDVVALPTTAITAPRASPTDDIVDPAALDDLCRFVFAGNLTGLPAATAPVGRAGDGLPVGLQIIGDAWDEACVLQVVAHLERMGVARVERPAVAGGMV
jgi:aspartyl-tRNA(Asn)/glutamyl-tRNA(Gln) amidotransferase subunit A